MAILHRTKRQAIQPTDAHKAIGGAQPSVSTEQTSNRGPPIHRSMVHLLNDSLLTQAPPIARAIICMRLTRMVTTIGRITFFAPASDKGQFELAKIYLINVGANLAHRSKARSPLFLDGTFVYVPFPLAEGMTGTLPYPSAAWPFTNNLRWYQTHSDPDWANLTYGDYTKNPRASCLAGVAPSDVLLFWSLLWENHGDSWFTFTNKQSWHLIGALRVEEILRPGDSSTAASRRNRERASRNAHFEDKRLTPGNHVFIGDRNHSQLFQFAVPLVKSLNRRSLLYRIFRTTNGARLPLAGKHWSSYLRSCRVICDLSNPDGLRRATLLTEAIKSRNDFDLLEGLC